MTETGERGEVRGGAGRGGEKLRDKKGERERERRVERYRRREKREIGGGEKVKMMMCVSESKRNRERWRRPRSQEKGVVDDVCMCVSFTSLTTPLRHASLSLCPEPPPHTVCVYAYRSRVYCYAMD